MYITGISEFGTVYMKLFIPSTLVKTQTLNIRIYSDRKNNYFYSNVYSN
jgi:ABC-type sulfate transport system permease component